MRTCEVIGSHLAGYQPGCVFGCWHGFMEWHGLLNGPTYSWSETFMAPNKTVCNEQAMDSDGNSAR